MMLILDRAPEDNTALVAVIEDAQTRLDEIAGGIAHVASIALPWEIRTERISYNAINILRESSVLDPRLQEFPTLAVVETRHIVHYAYGFNRPENLGLPNDFNWYGKLAPLVLNIECNHKYSSFQLINVHEEAALVERSAILIDQQKTPFKTQLTQFLTEHITADNSAPVAQHFFNSDLRAVTFSGDAPPDVLDTLKDITGQILMDYPHAKIKDDIDPSVVFAVGAAKYAKALVDAERLADSYGHDEL
jgi:hypothetical protein